MNILAALSMDMRSEVLSAIRRVDRQFGDDLSLDVLPVRFLEDIDAELEQVRDELCLLIVDEYATPGRDVRGGPDIAAAIAKLRVVRASMHDLPLVLLTAEPDMKSIEALNDLSARWVRTDLDSRTEKLEQRIEEALRRSVLGQPDVAPLVDTVEKRIQLQFLSDPPTYALVTVRNGEQEALPPWQFQPRGLGLEDFLTLSVELDEFINMDEDDVPNRLVEIGRRSAELFADGQFQSLYQKLQTDKTLSVQIQMCPENFGGLYEAVQLSEEGRPLALLHPIYRSVMCEGLTARELRWDGGHPVNILVIDAGTHTEERVDLRIGHNPDTYEPGGVTLPELPCIIREMAMWDRLREAVEAGNDFVPGPDWTGLGRPVAVNIGSIKVLRADDNPAPFTNRIRAALMGSEDPAERFDIVHFAGHAFRPLERGDDGVPLDPPKRGEVRLVVPTAEGDTADTIGMLQFANWLEEAGIQFVYLNCCAGIPASGGAPNGSNAASVAQLLAQRGIPLTLGFRWKVADESAFRFAAEFYRALFCDNVKFEQAMRSARKELHAVNGRDPVWASPILLWQTPETVDGG